MTQIAIERIVLWPIIAVLIIMGVAVLELLLGIIWEADRDKLILSALRKQLIGGAIFVLWLASLYIVSFFTQRPASPGGRFYGRSGACRCYAKLYGLSAVIGSRSILGLSINTTPSFSCRTYGSKYMLRLTYRFLYTP